MKLLLILLTLFYSYTLLLSNVSAQCTSCSSVAGPACYYDITSCGSAQPYCCPSPTPLPPCPNTAYLSCRDVAFCGFTGGTPNTNYSCLSATQICCSLPSPSPLPPCPIPPATACRPVCYSTEVVNSGFSCPPSAGLGLPQSCCSSFYVPTPPRFPATPAPPVSLPTLPPAPVGCSAPGGEIGIKTPIGCLAIGTGPGAGRVTISALILWSTGLSGTIGLILLIYSGYQIATSRSDPKRLAASRELVISVATGLLLIILALILTNFLGLKVLNLGGLGFNP